MVGTLIPGSGRLAGSGTWGDRRLPTEKAEEGWQGGGWAGGGGQGLGVDSRGERGQVLAVL